MRTKKIVITVIVVIVAVIAVGIAITLGSGMMPPVVQEEPTQAIDVLTARPETLDLENTMDFVGTLSAADSVNVTAKLNATVASIAVKPGDTVTAGQVLFTLSTEDIDSQLELAELSLLMGQLNYEMTTGITLPKNENSAYISYDNARDQYESAEDAYEDLVDNQDDYLEAMDLQIQSAWTSYQGYAQTTFGLEPAQAVVQAQTDYQQALADYQANPTDTTLEDAMDAAKSELDIINGHKTVYDAAVASKTSFQASVSQANAAVNGAEQGYNAAKIAYESVSGEAREIQEELALLQLNQAQINYQNAMTQLENATVTAPVDGVVLSLSVSVGNYPAQGSPAAVIGSPDSMELSFGVPTAYYTSVLSGSEVAISTADRSATGTISEITPMVAQGSGVFSVKAQTANPDGAWLSGATATVTLTTERAEDALCVPIDTVRFEGGKPYLYIDDGGFAKRAFITLGITDEEYYQVVEGISASDKIITTWHPNLTDGVELSDGQGG